MMSHPPKTDNSASENYSVSAKALSASLGGGGLFLSPDGLGCGPPDTPV